MGQRFSRRVLGGLEKGMEKHRHAMEKDALQQIKQREQAGIPFADSTGFQRGMGRLQPRKEIEQEAFLEKQQESADVEMPKDLIQFLNDVGPLEREVDKELTSPRLRDQTEDSLLQPPAEDIATRRHRKRRTMPLVELTSMDQAEEGIDESMMTTRTTNFSRSKLLSEEEDDLGVTDQGLYRLISAKNQNDNSIEQSLLEKCRTMSEKEDLYSSIIMQASQVLQIPTLMKDSDNSFVGVWPDRVEDLKRQKLTVVPSSRVQLNIAMMEPEEDKVSREKVDAATTR